VPRLARPPPPPPTRPSPRWNAPTTETALRGDARTVVVREQWTSAQDHQNASGLTRDGATFTFECVIKGVVDYEIE